MKRLNRTKALVAAAAVGLLTAGVAEAWYQPWGSGAMTYQRQDIMRDHGWAMRSLADMFDGRRAFNREEAVRLAREMEAGFGDRLIRNTAPGTVVAGSRTAPWTWRHFGAFQGYVTASRQAAGRLADALAEAPDNEAVQQQGAWSTSPRRGMGRWGHLRDDLVSMEAIQAYGQLNATCHSCHGVFRGGRW